VVSRSLDLSPELGLLRAPGNRVIVVTGPEGELAPCEAHVEYLRSGGPELDLGDALRRLRADHGITAVVCEGGAHLNAALLPAGLVDELHLVLSPVIVGGDAPLTLLQGPLLEPPPTASLVWLLEADGLLFSRYRMG
jgi:riboflavin biosynthesis pyrimidine reductase